MHRPSPSQAITVALRAIVLMLLAGNAWAQYAVSELPTLGTGAKPANLVIMIDDSGSMQSAYVPDGMGNCAGTRRFNAANFNALAYDPTATYKAPTLLDGSGSAPPPLSTSFTQAWLDGFNATSSGGSVNLATGYQPTAASQPGSSNQSFAPHPVQDLAAIGVSSTGGGGGGGGTVGSPGCATSGGGGGGGGGGSAVGAAAYYYVYDSTQTLPQPCSAPNTVATDPTAHPDDDNCYRLKQVTSAEQSNFANWYSFYRTRHLMVASSAAIAMADPGLSSARVSWRALSTCTSMTTTNSCVGWDGTTIVDNRLRTFTGAQVNSFYQWVSRVPAAHSTPTRSTWTYIGDYFSRGPNSAISGTSLGANGPYGINPNPLTGTAPAGEIACVENFNITLTDGQWNGDSQSPGAYFGPADRTTTSLPDGTTYTPSTSAPPTAIYGNDGTNADTLSDIAFHYWATNLRPDLTNSVCALMPYMTSTTTSPTGGACPGTGFSATDYWNPQNDPATWPHLVQFTIGLGMTSTMTSPGLPWWGNKVTTQYSMPGYLNLYNGTLPWPPISNSADQGDMGKAYDLWHAAINSRGLAFSAQSSTDLQSALETSLGRVKAQSNPGRSAAATNSTTLNSGSVIYQAGFDPSDWSGTLEADPIVNGSVSSAFAWKTTNAGTFASATGSPARLILTSGSTTVPTTGYYVAKGIQFLSTDTTFNPVWAALWSAVPPPWAPASAATDILNWVRGDQTNEVTLTTSGTTTGYLRKRAKTVLGDIVDSAPVFAWRENFGYGALPEGATYAAFVANKASGPSNTGMVYVGADDGMLHGFDASSGKEVFGYVPASVIPNLPALANPTYAHQFYVDQAPYVGDACIGGSVSATTPLSPMGCTWKTLLIGTTGAGGRGVFALDVTNPSSMSTSNVMWDLVGQPASGANGDPDLGYTIGKPIIARLNSGDWAAVFGNGYLSSNGCAVLYVVSLNGGTVTKIGTAGTTGAACSTPNGLGPVTLADVDGNMTTDFVYAGDALGNLWKFDLRQSTSSSWAPAFGFANPLFTASPNGSDCSSSPTTCQPITSAPVLGPALPGLTGTMVYFGTGRLFAVGDAATSVTQSFYGVLDQGTTAISGGQGALVAQTITQANNTRTISQNAVAPPKLGWFMNLPDGGERVTFSPLLVDGFVLFGTVVPNGTTCQGGGFGWLMAVSATTNTVGGLNFFTVGGAGADGVKSTFGVPEGFAVISDPMNKQDIIVVGGSQGTGTFTHTVTPLKGRISWHELVR